MSLKLIEAFSLKERHQTMSEYLQASADQIVSQLEGEDGQDSLFDDVHREFRKLAKSQYHQVGLWLSSWLFGVCMLSVVWLHGWL